MTSEQFDFLKADFLGWTGGFKPETSDDIATYVAMSMPFNLDAAEATESLRQWGRERRSLQVGRDVDQH